MWGRTQANKDLGNNGGKGQDPLTGVRKQRGVGQEPEEQECGKQGASQRGYRNNRTESTTHEKITSKDYKNFV